MKPTEKESYNSDPEGVVLFSCLVVRRRRMKVYLENSCVLRDSSFESQVSEKQEDSSLYRLGNPLYSGLINH
ncbi:MAG: hypothetical protein HQ591_11730 [candidate division Zixibacteria bacterium]|nr:hypothetical protein [Candidatus Tariuqbacter arcticus]